MTATSSQIKSIEPIRSFDWPAPSILRRLQAGLAVCREHRLPSIRRLWPANAKPRCIPHAPPRDPRALRARGKNHRFWLAMAAVRRCLKALARSRLRDPGPPALWPLENSPLTMANGSARAPVNRRERRAQHVVAQVEDLRLVQLVAGQRHLMIGTVEALYDEDERRVVARRSESQLRCDTAP